MPAPNYNSYESLPAMFFEQAEKMGEKPFLWHFNNKKFKPYSWKYTADMINRLSYGLKKEGVESGDRVILISENRPEWLIADFAIMAAGAITVPAHTTGSVENLFHVINDSSASTVIVSTKQLTDILIVAALKTGRQIKIISIEPVKQKQVGNIRIINWDNICNNKNSNRIYQNKRDETACIIYTSGACGAPKGVILSHKNILHNCMGAYEIIKGKKTDDKKKVFLSILPLSHAYEHTIGQMFPISIGAEIYYSNGPDKFISYIADVSPTYVIAVPRIFEVLRQRILQKVNKHGKMKAKLFFRTLELGKRRYENLESLSLLEKLQDMALDILVRREIKKQFGGKLKAFVSRGAPLNFDIGLFFTSLGIMVFQGYGQTEASPVISCNTSKRIKLHTVGQPLKGVKVKLAKDGEILVKGDLVMKGYWNNEKTTRECLDNNGWLHTGDIGTIDNDGFIEITDRKKDIIVNSSGDNISPQRIEGFLTLELEILQAMAYGDGKSHITALIVPDKEYIEEYIKDGRNIHEIISDAIERANDKLSIVEKVRNFVIADEIFTEENGLITHTLKLRRHYIRDRYREKLESMYKD
ncbi:MAG: long-chain fatty acid--CoA ligase [Alphaproteobacteria bacterium]|nr:long-chain fatty acid--CoA ligase [Alphaproteobacteria bacterium]